MEEFRMTGTVADVIDHLVGITPASPLHALRAQRTQARDNAEASFVALFRPDDPGEFALPDRHAVAMFVAGLHRVSDIAAFYADGLAAPIAAAIAGEVARGATQGPYGHYPAGPLSREDSDGPAYAVAPANAAVLGKHLAAALAHTHMLVFHPRDAAPEALQALLDAGWSTTAIVTLSQLVAFLSFQIRVVVGLRCLAAVG
jgi:CMD domain protein